MDTQIDNTVPHHRKYAELMREANKKYYYTKSRYKIVRKKLEAKGYSDQYIREYLLNRYDYVENES